MRSVNMHEAKTHLSRLVSEVSEGESILIARAGTPVARLVPIDSNPERPASLIGFLSGRVRVPADFDRMGEDELTGAFEGQA